MSVSGCSISVAIVAHNDWPRLRLAIESALQQSLAPSEVIVIDNGSTDATADEVPRLFPQVKLIRQADLLDSGGYNAGIRNSTGEFVQLLDGDDCLAPRKLALQAEAMRADATIDIAYGDYIPFVAAPEGEHYELLVRSRAAAQVEDMLLALCQSGGNVPGLLPGSVLFRRSLFGRVGMFDEALMGCDYDFWFRAAAAGAKFRFVPGSAVFYRQRPGQASRQQAALARRDEYTLAKAAKAITREPHHTLLTHRLARVQMWRALRHEQSETRAWAARKLREARESSRNAVPLWLYAIARAIIVLPFGRKFMDSRFGRALTARMS